MKKIIVTFIMALVLATSTASAVQLNISGSLTPEQKAELILQAEKMAAKKPDIPVKAAEIREWVEVGSAIGEGMAAAAGKLGIEVNKFAGTTVGTFTMVIIAYHYMGSELVSIIFGFSFLLFGIPMWVWLYTNNGTRRLVGETKYEKGKGPNGEIYQREYADTTDVVQGWYYITIIFIIMIGTLPIIF